MLSFLDDSGYEFGGIITQHFDTLLDLLKSTFFHLFFFCFEIVFCEVVFGKSQREDDDFWMTRFSCEEREFFSSDRYSDPRGVKEYGYLEYATIRYCQMHERCPATETIDIACSNRHRSAATHLSPTIPTLSISAIQLGRLVVLNTISFISSSSSFWVSSSNPDSSASFEDTYVLSATSPPCQRHLTPTLLWLGSRIRTFRLHRWSRAGLPFAGFVLREEQCMNVHRTRIGRRFLVLLGFDSGLVLPLDSGFVLLDFCLAGLGGMVMSEAKWARS